MTDPRQVRGCKCNANGPGVFHEVSAALGARNWDNIGSLRQDPGERELRRCALFLAGNFLDSLDQPGIPPDVLALKARRSAPVVTGIQYFSVAEFARQAPASESAVGNEPDAQLTPCRQK